MPADELTNGLAQNEIRDRIHWFQLDRRDFLKLCGGGLLVLLEGASSIAQESGRHSGEHELPQQVSAWVHIDADGRVTVFTGKVEVGQNIRTSLAQLVAEELRVVDDAGFDGLLEAGAKLRGWEGAEEVGVGEDGLRVVEAADEVFSGEEIDAGFAADGGVDLGEEGGGDLDVADAAHVDGCEEAGDVADDASTEG